MNAFAKNSSVVPSLFCGAAMFMRRIFVILTTSSVLLYSSAGSIYDSLTPRKNRIVMSIVLLVTMWSTVTSARGTAAVMTSVIGMGSVGPVIDPYNFRNEWSTRAISMLAFAYVFVA